MPAVLQPSGEPAFFPESQALGASGILVLLFTAAGPGRTTLRLVYRRSWEQDIPPLSTFEVTVEVF